MCGVDGPARRPMTIKPAFGSLASALEHTVRHHADRPAIAPSAAARIRYARRTDAIARAATGGVSDSDDLDRGAILAGFAHLPVQCVELLGDRTCNRSGKGTTRDFANR